MITKNFYNDILLSPAQSGADELGVISGYASAAFAARHMEDMMALPKRPKVHLVVGMFPQIGNLRANHLAFQQLSSTDFPTSFECRYIITSPPVHAKCYVWRKDGQPFCAHVGSVNYTKNAFNGLREVATDCDATEARRYFELLWDESIDCREKRADELVAKALDTLKVTTITPTALVLIKQHPYVDLPHVDLPLLMKKDTVIHQVSGLNWGQRPGREPNQGSITIPSRIAKTSFFPPLKEPFTVIADDDTSLICARVQNKAKGGDIGFTISTPLNNSDMGMYFRRRLGVASGAFVQTQDVVNYGRTYVTFYKIDDETYYMDFARP